jgi:hypothetical protein
MYQENNPYLRKLDQTTEARRKWSESEWLLNLLRTETGLEQHIPTEQEVLLWAQKLH